MPKPPAGQPWGDLRWSTFLSNHAKAILACDFFVAVTATFRLLYVFVVSEHGSRRLVRLDVTAHPSSAWTLQQLREVVGFDNIHRYLIREYVNDFETPRLRNWSIGDRPRQTTVSVDLFNTPRTKVIADRVCRKEDSCVEVVMIFHDQDGNATQSAPPDSRTSVALDSARQ